MIEIREKQDCCGCSACAAICPKGCITLRTDGQGFLYPAVDRSRCTDCHLCERVCPVQTGTAAGATLPRGCYAAYNRDARQRSQASSGGVFWQMAEGIIAQGGVVFGVTFDPDWNTIHSYATTLEQLRGFRTSKYVQSRMGDSYQQVRRFLSEGRLVLFSGTPCQVAGLRAFLRGKSYDNLFTVDFVCHGVPSPMVWQKYLDEVRQGIVAANGLGNPCAVGITSVNFRDKSTGWRGFSLRLDYSLDGKAAGSISQPVWENDYMLAFLCDYANRPSCFRCRFRGGASGSDVTIADFWGIEHCLPGDDDALREYTGEKGTSLVLLNSGRMADILTACHVLPVELSAAVAGNRAYLQDWPRPVTHDYFFRQLRHRSLRQAYDRAVRAGKKLQKYAQKAAGGRLRHRLKYKLLKYLYT